jgi:hypothetical protein
MAPIRPALCALVLIAARAAGAAPPGASWVEIGGNARVEFDAVPLPAASDLAPGAQCSAWVSVGSDAVTVGAVPWTADRRVSRSCDAAVLAVAQAAASDWRMPVRSWTPVDAVPVPVTFVAGDAGALRAIIDVQADRYGVSAAGHPPRLDLVEAARLQRAPEPRFPRSARKQVRAGTLPAQVTCALDLDLAADGRVTDAAVSDCPAPLIDAVTALGRAHRFSPRVVNGVPVASRLPVSVHLRAD